jgi:hypothetical protein
MATGFNRECSVILWIFSFFRHIGFDENANERKIHQRYSCAFEVDM